jgi:hypothetical protein
MTTKIGSEEQSSKVMKWKFVIIPTLVLAGIFVGLLVVDRIAKTDLINAANKGAWDFLEVLLAPVTVGWATVLFTGEQNKRQRKADDAQKKIALDDVERHLGPVGVELGLSFGVCQRLARLLQLDYYKRVVGHPTKGFRFAVLAVLRGVEEHNVRALGSQRGL